MRRLSKFLDAFEPILFSTILEGLNDLWVLDDLSMMSLSVDLSLQSWQPIQLLASPLRLPIRNAALGEEMSQMPQCHSNKWIQENCRL